MNLLCKTETKTAKCKSNPNPQPSSYAASPPVVAINDTYQSPPWPSALPQRHLSKPTLALCPTLCPTPDPEDEAKDEDEEDMDRMELRDFSGELVGHEPYPYTFPFLCPALCPLHPALSLSLSLSLPYPYP